MAARAPEQLYYPGTAVKDLPKDAAKDGPDVVGLRDGYWCFPREISPFKAAMAVLGSGDDGMFADLQKNPLDASIAKGYTLLQAATDIKSVEGLGGMAPPTAGTNTAAEADKNQFVPGITGKFTRDRRAPQSFTLRWDWDNKKAMHVNLAIDSTKYAFMQNSITSLKNPDWWQKKGLDAPSVAYQDRLINLNKISGYSKTDFEAAKDKDAYKKAIGEKIRNNWIITK